MCVCAGGLRAAELPGPLAACAAMMHDAERLACHDRAVAALESEELKQFSGSVTSMRRGDDGMILLTLDNGQVWHQEDGNSTLFIEPRDQVTVERASFGTFRITDKRGHSAGFKRLK